jgi:hypothetical protein
VIGTLNDLSRDVNILMETRCDIWGLFLKVVSEEMSVQNENIERRRTKKIFHGGNVLLQKVAQSPSKMQKKS